MTKANNINNIFYKLCFATPVSFVAKLRSAGKAFCPYTAFAFPRKRRVKVRVVEAAAVQALLLFLAAGAAACPDFNGDSITVRPDKPATITLSGSEVDPSSKYIIGDLTPPITVHSTFENSVTVELSIPSLPPGDHTLVINTKGCFTATVPVLATNEAVVPDLVGGPLSSVTSLLGGVDLFPGTITSEPNPTTPAGEVTGTTPSAGATVNFGSFVDITVSDGPITGALGTFNQNVVVGLASEPFSTATGELVHAYSADLYLGGPLPLSFARYYASNLAVSGVLSALGFNWMHNFDMSIGVSGTSATVTIQGGRKVLFTKSGGVWSLPNPERFNYQLNSSTGGYQFYDRGPRLIYSFNTAGALTAVSDEKGNTLTVAPGNHGPTKVSDGLGRTLTFTYDGAGNLASVKDQTGRTVNFAHSDGINLTSVTDAKGNTTTFSYTAAGALTSLMTAAKEPAGNTPWTQTWSSTAQVVDQDDSFGDTTTASYNSATGVSVVMDPLGNATQDTTLNFGELTAETDANEQTSTFTYDSAGHRTSYTDRLAEKTNWTYDPVSGYLASQTNPDTSVTSLTWAAATRAGFMPSDLTSVVLPDKGAITLALDAAGNTTKVTDQAGDVTTLTYNKHGQVVTSANAAGGVTSFAYNSDGTMESVKVPSGSKYAFHYDTAKRLTSIVNPDGTSRGYTWDKDNNLLSVKDERGEKTLFAYDVNNNLVSITDALGKTKSLAYDKNDRPASQTDRTGRTWSVDFNQAGMLKTFTNPVGETANFQYDPLQRPVSVFDASGKGTSYAYDKEGRPTSVTDALGRTSSFLLDTMGRATQATSPLAENYNFAYDIMGRLVNLADPLDRSTSLAYDIRGLLTGVTLPAGITNSLAHDALGGLIAATDPNGNVWDRARDNMDRLVSSTDPLGRKLTLSYDSRSRVSGSTDGGITAKYTYDAASNLTQAKYTGGPDLLFSYDADNRLIGANGAKLVYDANGDIIASNGILITRDGARRIASITFATGKTVTYQYNNRGFLNQVSDWLGGVTTFAYDAAGELVSITRPNGVVTNYTFDGDGRLATITEINGATQLGSTALTLDAAGQVTSANRTNPASANPPAGALNLTYDAADQNTGGGFSYDGLGRRTADSLLNYSWDGASRLTKISGAAGSQVYTYDGMGMRIAAGSNTYVLDYALPMVSISVVRNTAGQDQTYYVHRPDGRLLYAIDAGTGARHFYHFDDRGCTTLLTNDAGAVTDAYAISAFGEDAQRVTLVQPAFDNPFTFIGELGVMQEPAVGIFYMRSRYFDAETGRFISRDLLKNTTDPVAMNPYQYAHENPLAKVDPIGACDSQNKFANALFASQLPSLATVSSAGISGGINDFLPVSSSLGFKIFQQGAVYAAKAADVAAHAQNLFNIHQDLTNMATDLIMEGNWIVSEEGEVLFINANAPEVAEEVAYGLAVTNYNYEFPNGDAAVEALETESASLASKARWLKGVGVGLAVLGTAAQTTIAIQEDVNNGLGGWLTTVDAIATVGGNAGTLVLSSEVPAVATVDIATGGSVTGVIHNGIAAIPFAVTIAATDRVTSQQQDGVKRVFSRGWVLGGLYNASDAFWGWAILGDPLFGK